MQTVDQGTMAILIWGGSLAVSAGAGDAVGASAIDLSTLFLVGVHKSATSFFRQHEGRGCTTKVMTDAKY